MAFKRCDIDVIDLCASFKKKKTKRYEESGVMAHSVEASSSTLVEPLLVARVAFGEGSSVNS